MAGFVGWTVAMLVVVLAALWASGHAAHAAVDVHAIVQLTVRDILAGGK